MRGSPLQDHSERTSWKPATQNSDRIDADLNLGTSVDRVKMRRIVVIEVHANGDSKKAAYFRHGQPLPFFSLYLATRLRWCKSSRLPPSAKIRPSNQEVDYSA